MLVNGQPVKYRFVASSFEKNFPKFADAMFFNGKFTVEIGKPNTKPVDEGESFYFNILYKKN
jgi:hypothetical protein